MQGRTPITRKQGISNWDSDWYDWGIFKTWEPMPSPAEAVSSKFLYFWQLLKLLNCIWYRTVFSFQDILLEVQKREDEAVHARAAAKRAAKKAMFFARIFAKKNKAFNVRSRL